MKIYNNFFIGIPLPKHLTDDYKLLLNSLKKINPDLKLNSVKNIHITILFMGKQDSGGVNEVSRVIRKNSKVLKNCSLNIRNFGYFENKYYDVIYMKIQDNKKLDEFYNAIKEKLKSRFISEKKVFSPHLTLARVKNKEELNKSKNIVDKKEWEFPIKEIVLYGRDAKDKNKQVIIEKITV